MELPGRRPGGEKSGGILENAQGCRGLLFGEGRVNVSTVYRTLNTLTEKKILIRSVRQDGKAYYSLAKKDHSHRLVCDLCGKVIPVDTCPLSELEETLQQKTGFRITGHSLEFTGLCPECSKKDTDEK